MVYEHFLILHHFEMVDITDKSAKFVLDKNGNSIDFGYEMFDIFSDEANLMMSCYESINALIPEEKNTFQKNKISKMFEFYIFCIIFFLAL